MCVKLLDLDLVLILVGVVKDNYLHNAFKLGRILEINQDSSLAKFVLRLLPGFSQLLLEFDKVFGLNSLSTFLSNFVCSSWSFDFQIDFLGLVFLAFRLHDALVSHRVLMLLLLCLSCKVLSINRFVCVSFRIRCSLSLDTDRPIILLWCLSLWSRLSWCGSSIRTTALLFWGGVLFLGKRLFVLSVSFSLSNQVSLSSLKCFLCFSFNLLTSWRWCLLLYGGLTRLLIISLSLSRIIHRLFWLSLLLLFISYHFSGSTLSNLVIWVFVLSHISFLCCLLTLNRFHL